MGRLKLVPLPSEIPSTVQQLYPKNGVSDWIGQKKNDPKPICYLSGAMGAKNWDEDKFRKLSNARFRCFSYAYCGYDSPLFSTKHAQALDNCLANKDRIFLDSGAHSFHNAIYRGKNLGKFSGMTVAQMIPEFLQSYASYTRWCYHTKRHFDFHVTVDWDRKCQVVWDATQKLFKESIFPVPVYHGDSDISWLKRWADAGHKIIGIGIERKGKNTRDRLLRYYSTVLKYCDKLNVKCHGFAVTGDIMFNSDLPFYSVDSTTYLKAAAYGKILDIHPEKQRVGLIHVSSKFASSSGYGTVDGLSSTSLKHLRDQVESRGFDFELIRTDLTTRVCYNAKVTMDAIARHQRVAASHWRRVF